MIKHILYTLWNK